MVAVAHLVALQVHPFSHQHPYSTRSRATVTAPPSSIVSSTHVEISHPLPKIARVEHAALCCIYLYSFVRSLLWSLFLLLARRALLSIVLDAC